MLCQLTQTVNLAEDIMATILYAKLTKQYMIWGASIKISPRQ